ncbi:YcxB family protein [Altererythrobacter aquiaggeris]|uniref:YcxB family protein n=1 Tax=Aestuarierythrobacter aquiaggeris TaxID=1898396 RepID=UPI0030160B49
MAEHTIRFRITEQDVVRATKLGAARKLPIPVLPLILIGLAVALFAMRWDRMEESAIGTALAPALLALIVVVVLVQYLIIPWNARRHYRQSASLKDEITAQWDAKRIEIKGEHGSLKFDWSDFHRWSEDQAIILLYHSEQAFNAVPKSALDDHQLSSIKSYLQKAGVKKR